MKSVSLWRPSKSVVLKQWSGDHNHNLMYWFLLLKSLKACTFTIIAEYIFSVLVLCRTKRGPSSQKDWEPVINGLICKKKQKNILDKLEIVETFLNMRFLKLYWRYIILENICIASFSILKFHVQLNYCYLQFLCNFCELCFGCILFLRCKKTEGQFIVCNMADVIMSSLFDNLFTVWRVWWVSQFVMFCIKLHICLNTLQKHKHNAFWTF